MTDLSPFSACVCRNEKDDQDFIFEVHLTALLLDDWIRRRRFVTALRQSDTDTCVDWRRERERNLLMSSRNNPTRIARKKSQPRSWSRSRLRRRDIIKHLDKFKWLAFFSVSVMPGYLMLLNIDSDRETYVLLFPCMSQFVCVGRVRVSTSHLL